MRLILIVSQKVHGKIPSLGHVSTEDDNESSPAQTNAPAHRAEGLSTEISTFLLEEFVSFVILINFNIRLAGIGRFLS